MYAKNLNNFKEDGTLVKPFIDKELEQIFSV